MKVDFYLRFRTHFGQSIAVNGNFTAVSDQVSDHLPMNFLNEDFWHLSVQMNDIASATFQYQYIFTTETGEIITEAGPSRSIPLNKIGGSHVVVIDTWNDNSNIENAFYTAPFKQVLLPKVKASKHKKFHHYTHLFRVKAPLLQQHEVVCIGGSDVLLNEWKTEKPILLEKEEDGWYVQLNLSDAEFPLAYKYGIYNTKTETFTHFESGDNRLLPTAATEGTLTILHDGFVRMPNNTWKGAGVAIPVFSLRSEKSFGVGEFTDLKTLADWAADIGIKLIQILPINDTTATYSWQDSYPYAAISAFALHPIYINLGKVAGKKFLKTLSPLSKNQKALNALDEVDYESVLQLKMETLSELYRLNEGDFLKEKAYQSFFEDNSHWLTPYAAFCYLRDKYKTAEFSKWKTHNVFNEEEIAKLTAQKSKAFNQIAFYYFVQYHLHLQLKEATDYAHKKGIVVKGDIPIGIFRNGCDAWTAPQLYNMDQQAGAPPDDFAVKGQNWGFPTYNWQRMEADHFEWWRKRFHQMSYYFDAFRIDHILGFFRIWSIPAHAIEGIMGIFVPALPIHVSEFGEKGIWFDYDRLCKPFITDDIINNTFEGQSQFVKEHFVTGNNRGGYDLKEAFTTQKAIEDFFNAQDATEENKKVKQGLFDLVSNVILFEHAGSNGKEFHFRIAIEHTSSFQQLDESTKHKLKELYINYFYYRQDNFWKKEALRKLPALKASTNMLICGEDLGMVPHCVPDVMHRLGILSLEIQRMPKNPSTEFFNPKHAPYLSVITPSTHDMSTIRGWWEEDRQKTQRFYNSILEESGEAPFYCEDWINRAIILQHLYSPAMWSIFQLQDLMGMNEILRRVNPMDERINEPANPKHYWRYRMHLTLEQLHKEEAFNEELKDYITKSGR